MFRVRVCKGVVVHGRSRMTIGPRIPTMSDGARRVRVCVRGGRRKRINDARPRYSPAYLL